MALRVATDFRGNGVLAQALEFQGHQREEHSRVAGERADGQHEQPNPPAVTWGKTIRKVTAGRKTKAPIMASGAPIRNARSRSRHRAIGSSGHRVIGSSKTLTLSYPMVAARSPDGPITGMTRFYLASYTVLPPTTVRRTFVSRIFGGRAAVMS